MDQLASVAGVEGAALLLDCRSLEVTPVPLPPGVELVALHSGQPRALETSAYGERRAQCERAEREIGPLRDAGVDDIARLTDPVLRRRARHVVTENQRVLAMVEALQGRALDAIGPIMAESHASLRDDFEVSTAGLDEVVRRLRATAGVLGARLTGGGFGGVAVALVETGATVEGWRLRPSQGARILLPTVA
jgi:galactokinase